jgi:uncharacterized protein DUF429
MKIYGIDFTSSPSKRKPITCLECELAGSTLTAGTLLEWPDFNDFEEALRKPGLWIAGIDFPFGQARRFIETIGWPDTWEEYVKHAASLGRDGFVDALNAYRRVRVSGDKEHKRITDKLAHSISPQKIYGVPVGKMFYEGAPRLLESGVMVPGLHRGDPRRIVVEAYPGILARALIGRKSYKNDTRRKQTPAMHNARAEILDKIKNGAVRQHYDLKVSAPPSLADDPTGDSLDALLCAIQAAFAWKQRDNRYGEPANSDPLEGWIADPMPEIL